MSSYIIGIDFGTSQTKVCVLNEELKTRKFYKFPNGSLFLPSVIVKNKSTGKFSYGNTDILDNAENDVFRYFKMAAVEDEDLIQRTYEDKDGKLEEGKKINDYRKYSSQISEKPENLVILFLCYVQLYIQGKIESTKSVGSRFGGFLSSVFRNSSNNKSDNTYFISLGIPTEWNNPKHIKRKAKFQSLLLISKRMVDHFGDLESFMSTVSSELLFKIDDLSASLNAEKEQRSEISMDDLLLENRLAVMAESAAGINYLLKNSRLKEGAYATLDIGAGTSDLAMFQVGVDQQSVNYFCSETVAIAANDYYRKYAEVVHGRDNISLNEINILQQNVQINVYSEENETNFQIIRNEIRGADNFRGVEGALMRMFYKPFIQLYNINKAIANAKRNRFSEIGNIRKPIILFGGGSSLPIFNSGYYAFFHTPTGNLNQEYLLNAESISKYISTIDVQNPQDEIQPVLNLLVLALGLTYINKNSEYIPFTFQSEFDYPEPEVKFEYYDLLYDTYR